MSSFYPGTSEEGAEDTPDIIGRGLERSLFDLNLP